MTHNNQKVILITGTSSGFGLLASARLASFGHFVYATMRDLKKQQPLLDEVARRGGQVQVRELDVTKPATIAKVVEEIQSRHKHIDVVINNAGFGLGGFFEDLDEDQIRWQMEVNFFGVQNVCRAVVPLMREFNSGMIINLSSIAGLTATPSLSSYNASKWALEGFSESLYYELAPFGVKVVLVEPGSYPTEIFTGNRLLGRRYDDPKSPYYAMSQKIKAFVEKHISSSKKDPEKVAALIEKIINSKFTQLRYISDYESGFRVRLSKMFPPQVYDFIYRKLIYKA